MEDSALLEEAGCSFRFRPEEHLKGRDDIRDVFGRGRRFGCRGAKLLVLNNGLPHNRVCFTFSRGFGNAVQRNRTRRLCREAYRHLRNRLSCGYDVILLMYPEESGVPARKTDGVAQSGFAVKTEQLRYLFSKAGLLQ